MDNKTNKGKTMKKKKYTELLFVYAPITNELTASEVKDTFPTAWKHKSTRFFFDKGSEQYLNATNFQRVVYNYFNIPKRLEATFDNHFGFLSEILEHDKKTPVSGYLN